MAKKDKSKKTAEHKARVAAKQSKKAVQKGKKAASRPGLDDDDDDGLDLEAQLEEYARQQAQFLKVTETPCEPPPARSASSVIASVKELFLFGGEVFDGLLARFHNDLHVYQIDKEEWRVVTSPNSPLPRSGHAWCRGGNSGGIYMFGGEFSSPKQGTFYHYNDFWHLDPSTREWNRIECKKGPSARSGHRMTFFKNYILLFGGFQDTSQQTKYLQDLWIYDCQEYVWHSPNIAQATQKPDPRSSFTFLPHEQGAVLYGGYSRVKPNKPVGSRTKVTYVPKVHEDAWFLRITTDHATPQARWERRKKPVNSPTPARAGITQVFHKGRGLFFGGVHDVEESDEGIESEFFDQLFVWNIDRNRFFPLALRRSRVAPKRTVETKNRRQRGKADELELLQNLAALEQRSLPVEEDSSDEDVKIEKPMSMTMPHRRYNAQLAVAGDTLFIYGGTFERGDREYNFDELHAIDLGKMDGVTEIFRRPLPHWDEAPPEESSDEDSEGGASLSSSPSREESVEPDEVIVQPADSSEDPAKPEDTLDSPDRRPHPRAFESLREFFARTGNAWQELVLGEDQTAQSVKEIRKLSFAMAEVKWWDSREDIAAEEQRQEEAGIGDVVSLAVRTGKRR